MRTRRLALATLTLFALTIPPSAAGEEPTAAEVRAAVAKALPLLWKGANGHLTQRTCFACHNQHVPIQAQVAARSRGFDLDEGELRKQLEFIASFLERNRENYRKGRGQGGQVYTAGYALLTLELGGWKPDATTAAVTEYLLLHQQDSDHWRVTSNRPPSEVSDFTANYIALRALQTYGTTEQQERIGRRTEQVRGWLLKTPARDTEDRVFRLGALKRAGAEADAVKAAAEELLRSQRPDGGWAQLEKMESDAYATGTALVLLHEAGSVTPTDPAYRRGVRFLLGTQRDDGSWYVKSRSKPFQTYFETGFPHGKDQFISSAASGWAATALALACPPGTDAPPSGP